MNGQPLAVANFHTNTNIRPVQADDVAGLCSLWPHRSEFDVTWLVKRARQQAVQGRGLGVVMSDEKGGTVIAYGQITLWRQTAEIADLAVLDAYQGKGLGTMLVQYLVQASRQMQAHRVEIGAAMSNPRALSLYCRLGFRQHRIIEIDLGNGAEPVIYLTLELI